MIWSWIETVALYALGMGLLCWLGGISSAGDALLRWGRATADRRRSAVSSSS
jgi:hypothetical protein